MSLQVAQVNYFEKKNCFIALSGDLAQDLKLNHGTFQVFELQYGTGSKAFFSWSGEKTPNKNGENGVLSINSFYADKLKLPHKEQVLIKVIQHPPRCVQVYLDPLSSNDWEILEKHVSAVESRLMDQLRVVWPGQILPFWVQNVCIFMKVGEISPIHECVILDNETEVIVSPKVRNHTKSTSVRTARRSVSDISQRVKKSVSVSRRSKTTVVKIPNTEQPSNWSRVISFISKRTPEFMHTPTSSTEIADFEDLWDESEVLEDESNMNHHIPNLSLVLRVQPMRITSNKINRSVASEIESLDPVAILEHPSTVFIHANSIDNSLPNCKFQHPKIFYAKIQKLNSPRDLEHEKNSKLEQKQEKQSMTKDKKESKVFGVVRVVVIDSETELCDPVFDAVVDRLLAEQTVREGKIIVQDQLRKLLKLDVTGRVWLTEASTKPVQTQDLFLNTSVKLSAKLNREDVCEAFKKWLAYISDVTIPLLVFQGIFVKFPVVKDVYSEIYEAQLTFGEMSMDQNNPGYLFLDPGKASRMNVNLMNYTGSPSVGHWPIQPMLAYTTLDSLDPSPSKPQITLAQLGGIDDIFQKGLQLIDMYLGVKPLSRSMFAPVAGSRNGILLITGPKGSGKTALAKALCSRVTEAPTFAYSQVIDCKTIRGKKPDHIHILISSIVSEAVWRQPSVILLDDLDQVTGNPSGPETEMSAEALYAARIAEVIKDILKKEVQNNSHVCFLATALSRSSINTSLVSSRGTHFIQEILEIQPPNKVHMVVSVFLQA
ncbi:hypothetical protein ScPMuIL_018362 [Solemya velum]